MNIYDEEQSSIFFFWLHLVVLVKHTSVNNGNGNYVNYSSSSVGRKNQSMTLHLMESSDDGQYWSLQRHQ